MFMPTRCYDKNPMTYSSTRTWLCALLLSILGMAVARWTLAAAPVCPDTQAGETERDCPWAGVARTLIAQADSGHERDVGNSLKQLLPDLDRSLQEDSRRQGWKRLWGQSINYDEFAHGIIVHPAILGALGQRFGIRAPMTLTHVRAEGAKEGMGSELLGKPSSLDPAGHPLAHAGLEHTYGYLFSVLKTSYGYKRARWVDGEIEEGFGIKPGLLGPRPAAGTLFSNVTYFAGRIAFRDEPGRLAILKAGAKALPAEVRDFDFSKVHPIRLEETVQAKDSTGDVRAVALRTDLVPFIHVSGKNSHWLIYSIHDPSEGGTLLVTAFPVNSGFVDMVTKAEDLGENKPVVTRYNGFVEGVTGHKLTGNRKVIR
jgi:hypothetical protein